MNSLTVNFLVTNWVTTIMKLNDWLFYEKTTINILFQDQSRKAQLQDRFDLALIFNGKN